MFDESKADRAVKFIKKLRHTGDYSGMPFNLLDWQEKIIRDLFGTVNEDGTRQYREAFISMGRKNGKTELAAAIALYCLFADGQISGEIYAAAGDRDQAARVFDASKMMVEQSETLSKNSKIIDSQKRIVFLKKNSFYRVVSSEAYTKHGYNPSVIICDELHVWPNRDLYDTLRKGIGTRIQPLIINITTAGYDKNSLCWNLYTYAKKIKDGIHKEDPTFYPAIFELDKEDDWKDEGNWYKANPGLGIYRNLQEMRDAFKRACEIPAEENDFKQYYLNMWTEQNVRWLQIEKWNDCFGNIDQTLLIGKRCYGGLDLSSNIDLTAFVLLFSPEEDGIYKIIPQFFVPEETLRKRSREDRVPYDIWAKEGLIIPTPGNVIDYNWVMQEIREAGKKYELQEIGYDPHQALKMAVDLNEEGFKMIPVYQTFKNISPPTKELENLILKKEIQHDGNKVLSWMFKNVSMKKGPDNTVKPDKEKSPEKIDGIIALIMALDGAIRNGTGASVYESRGVLTIEPDEDKIESESETEPQKTEKTDSVGLKCARCGRDILGEHCSNCGARVFANETSLHA